MACSSAAAIAPLASGSGRIIKQTTGGRLAHLNNPQTIAKHPLSLSLTCTELRRGGWGWRVPKAEEERKVVVVRAASETRRMAAEKSGIKIIKNPPESKLTELGVRSWPKWGCPPSKFPWTYSSKETCYLLKGKVKVYPAGSDEAVEIAAGDLVEFPKGMSCTWDVSETVDKHYNFD